MQPPRSLLAAALRLLLVAAALVLAPSCLPGPGEVVDSGEAVASPSIDAQVLAYDRATGAFEPALLADLAPPAELLHNGQLWRLAADGLSLVGPAQPAELAEANATCDAARPGRAPARSEWVLVTTPAGEVLEHRRLRDVVPGSTIAFQGRLYDTRGWPQEGVTAVRATGDVYGRVVHTFARQAPEVIDAVVAYPDGTQDLLTGTPNHPFWVSALDAYVPLGDLLVGARLHVQGGGEAILVSKTWRQGDFEVFDIEVEGLHSFYVSGGGGGGDGVLVHNSGASRGGLFANKFPSHAVGSPIQTFTAQQASRSSFNRKLNYVVTEGGELRLGRISNEVGGGHIDLAGGAAVQAAGEVKIVGGQIRMIDNSSGHYLPSGAGAQAAAETAFQNAGFSTAGTYVEKVWSGSAWVPK